LSTSPNSNSEKTSWILKSENGAFSSSGFGIGDRALGEAIATGLAASGGNGVVQHDDTKVSFFMLLGNRINGVGRLQL
jgi:hypothetical protein